MSTRQSAKSRPAAGEQSPLLAEPSAISFKAHKTVRIAVTGDVALNELETAVVDAADFQRLRRIKQLGTVYLVYPTAVHTRFDHSLGTFSMAVEMVRAIRENRHSATDEREIPPEDEQLIRVFALLHDITHVPFGHTLEDEFCIFPRHDEDVDRVDRFLGEQSEIGRILIGGMGYDLYRRFIRLYSVGKDDLDSLGGDLYIYDIVNNTACADLLDYLRRDSYFCNIVLDMEYRFLKYLYLRQEGHVKRLVIRLWKEGKARPRRDVLSELIRLLDNRYLLGERVYFHHAKLIAGTMMAAAVYRAKAEGELAKSDLYDSGDETLLDVLCQSRIEPVRRLGSALRDRRLWKRVYERGREAIAAEQAKLRDWDLMHEIVSGFHSDPAARREAEDTVAALTGISPGDLLIYCPDERMAMKLAEMKVFWNGSLRPLKDCTDDPIVGPKLSTILKSHENLWAVRVFLNPEHMTSRDTIISACENLFCFDPTQKTRWQQLFYADVVQHIVASEGLGAGMLHQDYEERAGKAVQRLVSHTSALRDRKTVTRFVRDAFGQ
jgi:HD superfamily phosphohydrolase